MNRRTLLFVLMILFVAVCVVFTACDITEPDPSDGTQPKTTAIVLSGSTKLSIGEFNLDDYALTVVSGDGSTKQIALQEDYLVGITVEQLQKAGNYTFVVKYDEVSTTFSIVVSSATFDTLSFSDKTVIYDGNTHSIEVVGVPKGATVTYAPANLYTNAGVYNVVATITADGYETETLSATLIINKASYDMSKVSLVGKSVTYDGQAYGLTVEGELPQGVSVSIEDNNHIDVGKYTIVAHFVGDEQNYNTIPDMSATLTIVSADITGISFADGHFTYDGNQHALQIEGVLPQGVSVEYSDNNQINAGTYTVTAKFTSANKNYNNLPDMTAQLVIDKQSVSVPEADNRQFVYDGTEQVYNIIDTDIYAVMGNKRTDAGTQTVSVYLRDAKNYIWSDGQIDTKVYTFTIAKCNLTLELTGSKYYLYDGNLHKDWQCIIVEDTTIIDEEVIVEYSDNPVFSGKYLVTGRLKNGQNYTAELVSDSFTIVDIDIICPSIIEFDESEYYVLQASVLGINDAVLQWSIVEKDLPLSLSKDGILTGEYIGGTEVAATIRVYSLLDEKLQVEKSVRVFVTTDVSVSISLDKTEIGNTGAANLVILEPKNENVVVSCANEIVDIIRNNSTSYVIKVKEGVKIISDTRVEIVVSLERNNYIFTKTNLLLLQTRAPGEPVSGGNTGLMLTQGMFKVVDNPSLTVDGVLIDKTKETSNGKIAQNSYGMKVLMEQDRWCGQWWISGNNIVTSNTYRKSPTKTATINGNTDAVLEREYIDKNNKLAYKTVCDNQSIPSLWTNEHLWNMLSIASVDLFRYANNFDTAALNKLGFVSTDANDPTLAAFKVEPYESNNIDIVYLLSNYIAKSMTPLLTDNESIADMYVVVDTEKILGMYLVTEQYNYWGTKDNLPVQDGSPISTSWTEVCLTFSDIGTTCVPAPTPYKLETDKPLQTEAYGYLQKALESIKSTKNYTFVALDSATDIPNFNNGAYVVSDSTFRDYDDTVGIGGTTNTGTVGYVVANTSDPYIIIESVGKYSYGMDDNLYHFTYTGYRGFSDNTYEEFAYDATLDGFNGTRLVKKDITSVLPTFDFAAEIFEFDGYEKPKDTGLPTYTFRLRDNALTYDVVQQFSLDGTRHSANSGLQNNAVRITIVVDANDVASIYSTNYPYSFANGAYEGTIETYYYNIGTTDTKIDSAKVFANYERRVLPETWADIKHGGGNSGLFPFYYLHTSDLKEYPGVYNKETGEYDQFKDPILSNSTMEYVINRIFGNAAKYMPAPSFFLGLFDDNLTGPWYDYTASSAVKDGYIDMIKITLQVDDVDENNVLLDREWQKIVGNLKKAFAAWNNEHDMTEANGGWKYSSSMSTPEAVSDDDMSYRYAVFLSDGLTIVFNNIHGSYVYINVYTTGEWSRTNNN